MLSNAYFLAKFRFDTAENEPAKRLQYSAKKLQNCKLANLLILLILINFANFAVRRPVPARELVRAAALLEDAVGLGELRGRGLEPRVVVDVGPRVGHLLFV